LAVADAATSWAPFSLRLCGCNAAAGFKAPKENPRRSGGKELAALRRCIALGSDEAEALLQATAQTTAEAEGGAGAE
jgi:hypothetical protein